MLKVQTLKEKKRHYEAVLRQEPDGLDDEFATLEFLSQELQMKQKHSISKSGIENRDIAEFELQCPGFFTFAVVPHFFFNLSDEYIIT